MKTLSRGVLGHSGTLAALTLSALVGCGPITVLGENLGGVGGLGHGEGGADRGGADGKAAGGTGGLAETDPQGGNPPDGSGGTSTPTPYPLNPTIPIDADCTCEDEGSVCNAAGACVPRCHESGVCAVWRIERGVIDLVAAEENLYLLLHPHRDELGYPTPGVAGGASLWKARYPSQAPEQIAQFEDSTYSRIIGHVGGKTYVRPTPLYIAAIDDDGTMTTRRLPLAPYQSQWYEPEGGNGVGVNSGGVFMLGEQGIFKVPLDLSSAPTLVVAETGIQLRTFFVGDRVWFLRADKSAFCSFDPNAPDELTCSEPRFDTDGYIFGARNDDFFFLWYGPDGFNGSVLQVNVSGSATVLYRPIGFGNDWPVLGRGLDRVFTFGKDSEDSEDNHDVFLSFPLNNPEPPVTFIPNEITAALLQDQPNTNAWQIPRRAANSTGVFWVQMFVDHTTTDANLSRYVFRAAP